jgi:SOS-response transcriptional repressor LexA
MEKKGIIHQQIADALGIERSAVTLTLANTKKTPRYFNVDQINKIAKLLDVDPVVLLYGTKKIKQIIENAGGSSTMRSFYIPLLQPAEAHLWRLENMETLLSDPNRVTMPVPSTLKDCFLFPMYDLAMISDDRPSLNYDDVLIYDPAAMPQNGEYAIVKFAAQDESVCRVYSTKDGKQAIFKALNPRFPDIIPATSEDFQILGVVRQIITKPPVIKP